MPSSRSAARPAAVMLSALGLKSVTWPQARTEEHSCVPRSSSVTRQPRLHSCDQGQGHGDLSPHSRQRHLQADGATAQYSEVHLVQYFTLIM